MKTWFLRRDYHKNLVEPEMKKFKFSHLFNKKSQNRTLKRILLVAIALYTYHPFLNSLRKELSKILISYTGMKKLSVLSGTHGFISNCQESYWLPCKS